MNLKPLHQETTRLIILKGFSAAKTLLQAGSTACQVDSLQIPAAGFMTLRQKAKGEAGNRGKKILWMDPKYSKSSGSDQTSLLF